MVSMSSSALTTALFGVLLSAAVVTAGPGPCGGCPAPVDPADYQDKVAKCVQLINEGKEMSAPRPLRLVEVESMTKQIVAGAIYAINMKLRDNSGKAYTIKAEMVETLPLPTTRYILRSVIMLLESPAEDPDCPNCPGCPCKQSDPTKFVNESNQALGILNANATLKQQLRVTGRLTLQQIVSVTTQVVDGMKYDIEMIAYDSNAPTARVFNVKVTIKILGNKKTLLSASLVQFFPQPPKPILKASLAGSKMVPQPTKSTMTATVAITELTRTSAVGQCMLKGASGVTAVLLQQGTATTNGNVITWLLPNLSKTPLSGDFSFTFTINLTTIQVPSGVANATALLNSGRTWVYVRTTSNASGAIRGQLLPGRRRAL